MVMYDIAVEYGSVVLPVKQVKFFDEGALLITDYGVFLAPYEFSLFKGIGRIIHSAGKAIGHTAHAVVKGVGRVIHYTGKFVGKIAPIAVPLLVGVGISAVAGSLFGATIAKASAATVAKAALSGHFLAAATQAVAFAGKVVATNLVSNTILSAIYKRPKGEVVIARGRQPALVIPAFVRELVEPHHLVNFITANGRLHNSRQIQARVDWLANKIKETAKRIVAVYRAWGISIDEGKLINELRNIFYNIPPTQGGIEAKINSYLNNLNNRLCRDYINRVYNNLVRFAPAGFQSKHPPSSYYHLCRLRIAKEQILSRIESDIRKYRLEQQQQQLQQLQQRQLQQRQLQQQRAEQQLQQFQQNPKQNNSQNLIPILGGILILALLARRR